MPKTVELEMMRFVNFGALYFNTVFDEKLYLDHKKAIKKLLEGHTEAGAYNVIITSHYRGLYYTYTLSTYIYTPENHR